MTLVASSRETLRICLLDDDSSVLRATGRLLVSGGWEVESFTDPALFLDYVGQHHPHVVVIDIWMPLMSGLEVQRRLKQVAPSTRVIVLTAKDDPVVRARALGAGALAVFLKPVGDEEFLARIQSALIGD